MKSFVAVAMAVLALATITRAADVCIPDKSVGFEGETCDLDLPCAQHLFCSRESVCTKRLEDGESCFPEIPNQCAVGLTCRGALNVERCGPNANPGFSCSDAPGVSTARCGYGLFCDTALSGSTRSCSRAKWGDSCFTGFDCLSGLCTNGKCTGQGLSFPCTSDAGCNPGFFCLNGVCSPYGAEGAFCSPSNPCDYGLLCVNLVPNSPATNGTCTKPLTLEPGAYAKGVGSASSDAGVVCRDSLFINPAHSTCSEKRPTFCNNPSNCAVDSTCFCGGSASWPGQGIFAPLTGTCGGFKCFGANKAVLDCLNEHCKIHEQVNIVFQALSYTESCGSLNCKAELQSFIECAAAGVLSLSHVALAVALIAALLNFY